MAFQIAVRTKQGGAQAWVDKNPDECPVCHFSISPMDMNVSVQIMVDGSPMIERIFQCPNEKCEHLFLARYFRSRQPNQTQLELGSCLPLEIKTPKQTETILKVSPDFCSINEQAYKAEQHGLALVAGPGYRKALEFLIKDYVISQFSEKDAALAAKKGAVEKMQLGACIATYIKSEQIKEIAKRAAWLGNDETHYVRKWEDKDYKI